MQKTLAQLKRDIDTGAHIEYVECKERQYNSELQKHSGERTYKIVIYK